jgi:hypothetical protein
MSPLIALSTVESIPRHPPRTPYKIAWFGGMTTAVPKARLLGRENSGYERNLLQDFERAAPRLGISADAKR